MSAVIGQAADQRVLDASAAVTNASTILDIALCRIGFAVAYVGEDPKLALKTALDQYARAVARHEMLCIRQSEDFYVCMARSAGAAES